MRLSFRDRFTRSARRSRSGIEKVGLGVVLVCAAFGGWQIGRSFYFDVRMRQDLAYLVEAPCLTNAVDVDALQDKAEEIVSSYGLEPNSASVQRVSDCVVRIDVNGERTVDLWVTRFAWPVHFTLESK